MVVRNNVILGRSFRYKSEIKEPNQSIMKITVVGTGYVGLVTGACLADVGIQVTCVDIDQNKIDGLKNGIMPIY